MAPAGGDAAVSPRELLERVPCARDWVRLVGGGRWGERVPRLRARQVPCGIFDDKMRFTGLFEDVRTIQKAQVRPDNVLRKALSGARRRPAGAVAPRQRRAVELVGGRRERALALVACGRRASHGGDGEADTVSRAVAHIAGAVPAPVDAEGCSVTVRNADPARPACCAAPWPELHRTDCQCATHRTQPLVMFAELAAA